MIMAGSNKTDVLWVDLKNQEQVEIVPLLKKEGLSCLQEIVAMQPEQVEGWKTCH